MDVKLVNDGPIKIRCMASGKGGEEGQKEQNGGEFAVVEFEQKIIDAG